MRFRQNRRRPILNAKTFTIAMVAVNAIGLIAVQHKLKQAEIPNAYALDDGTQTMVAHRDVLLPDNRVLPEVALAKAPVPLPADPLPALPAIKAPPVIDMASLDLLPVTPPEPAFGAPIKRGLAAAVDAPIRARPVRARLQPIVPSASVRSSSGDTFSAAFDRGLESTSQVGLTTPENPAVSVDVGPAPALGDVAAPISVDVAPPAASLTAPTLAPSTAEPAATGPSEEAPAELPAAA